MASKTTKTPTREDMPEEQVRDLQAKYENVNVRILRRNSKGHLASVWRGNKEPKELWILEDWLRDFAGGGDYRIEVYDPNDLGNRVCDAFRLHIEGPPKPPSYVGSYAEQTAGPRSPIAVPPAGSGKAPPPMPPWVSGLHPSEQGKYMEYMRSRYGSRSPAPGATVASDQLALKELAAVKAEKSRLEAKLEAVLEKYETETTRLRDELNAMRAEVLQQRSHSEVEALKMQITAMREQPKSPGFLNPEAIAALAPVLVALINGRATSAEAAQKMQFEGMQTFMKATLEQANKDGGIEKTLATIGPLVLPLITKLMEQKDPEKQAALFESMAANNLNSIAMMAQLVEGFANANAGEQDKWWVALIRETLGGVVQAAERYVSTPGGLPGQPPGLPQPARPNGSMATRAPGGVYSTLDFDDDPEEAAQAIVVDGDDVQRAVPKGLRYLFGMLPQAYQTQEWQIVLHQLHEEPARPVERVAEGLAGLLEKLFDDGRLPEEISDVMSHPQERLEAMLEKLPCSQQRAEWSHAVLRRTVAMLVEDGYAEGYVEAQVAKEPPEESKSVREELEQASAAPQQLPAHMQGPSMTGTS